MSSVSPWCSAPKLPRLDRDEVHVWRAALNLEKPRLHSLKQILSEDERARTERFYFEKDREHFIAARGLLRTILGRYLDQEPSELRFCYSRYGKPSLAASAGESALRFNISHAHGLALYAVTSGREIGIDLEHLRADFAGEDIAERFFSRREVEALRALPADMRQKGFFNCWTRKEAYIKARGEGLSLPLDKFDVSLAPGEPAALLSTPGDPREAARWSLRELEPGPGYVAALVVEGHDWRLKCWQWTRS
jgi:4'-phosphopantetheinyl transferase